MTTIDLLLVSSNVKILERFFLDLIKKHLIIEEKYDNIELIELPLGDNNVMIDYKFTYDDGKYHVDRCLCTIIVEEEQVELDLSVELDDYINAKE